MGKHEKEKEKSNFKVFILILAIIIVVGLLAYITIKPLYRNNNQGINKETSEVKNAVTDEGKKLVFKSNNDYNKKIEYYFENDVLQSVKIYEQYEEKEQYEKMILTYSDREDIKIIKENSEELSIEIEKKDLGSDEGLTYQEIYDKYTGIIGAYEIVK